MEQEIQPEKSTFKKFWWIGAIVIILIGATLIFANMQNQNDSRNDNDNKDQENRVLEQQQKEMYEREHAEKDRKSNEEQTDDSLTSFKWPSVGAKYITAVPVDLTQIQSISKFRSCAGHDRSGYNFDQVLETDRSMKHYLFPIEEFQGTTNKIKIFAPFDGTVSEVFMHDNLPGKRPKSGNGINFSNSIDENAIFGFGHIYFVKEFKVGDSVKAGELIGYAALGEKGFDFDIDLMGKEYYGKDQSSREVLGSAFDHMTESVLAEFAKYGITAENTKVTKEYRDSHACNYGSGDSSGLGGRSDADSWIKLKH